MKMLLLFKFLNKLKLPKLWKMLTVIKKHIGTICVVVRLQFAVDIFNRIQPSVGNRCIDIHTLSLSQGQLLICILSISYK